MRSEGASTPENPIRLTPGTRDWLPQELVRGTRDWLPRDFDGLDILEGALLGCFYQAGYERIRTPILEYTELHERRSGAEIVSKLFPVGDPTHRMSLRPELTAGVVRAYAAMQPTPPLPWRVSVSGPVFRNDAIAPNQYREFQQVGVELLGGSGPEIDGEVIWLADWSLSRLGVAQSTVRIGHMGVVLELLDASDLPTSVRQAIRESLVQGKSVQAVTNVLDHVRTWIDQTKSYDDAPVDDQTRPELERLYRMMSPSFMGRRTTDDVLNRLRSKWDLSRKLTSVIEKTRDQIRLLAKIKAKAPEALQQLSQQFGSIAPNGVAQLQTLIATLNDYGIESSRIEIDMEFGRAPGYYSGMYFELLAPQTNQAQPIVVCGGGRYDGLPRTLGSAKDDRGVGFAFGLERLWHVLGYDITKSSWRGPFGFLVVPEQSSQNSHAIAATTYLRNQHQRAILEPAQTMPEAIKRAETLGLAYILMVRGPWKRPGSLVLRHRLSDALGEGAGVETVINAEDLASYFQEWSEEPTKHHD